MAIIKKEKNKVIFELEANISLECNGINQIPNTKSKVVLNQDNISIFPQGWGTYIFSFREIVSIQAQDYILKLFLNKGNILTISQLGYQYEDFVRMITKLRNGVVLKDMLFQEVLKKSGFEADFSFFNKDNKVLQNGKAEFVFYQTSLVVMPDQGDLIRILFSNILESQFNDFQVEIKMENEEKIIIKMLGEKFDLFKETLENCLDEINLNTQKFIQGIWSDIDFETLNKLSKLIKDGKAINKKDVEMVTPEFWEKMEKALQRTEIKDEYEFLKNLSSLENIHIGFKKGLMGKLSGDYLWFLIPIKTSNVIAFETAGEKDKGRATYFFKIMGRKEFNKERVCSIINEVIRKINLGLIAINFRREPIYIPEDKLDEPDYVKYKFSIMKIPEIKLLRDLFIGKIIHRDDKQWQESVKELLEFNVKSNNDLDKWGKEDSREN